MEKLIKGTNFRVLKFLFVDLPATVDDKNRLKYV